jgi:hypothetical protein
MDSQANSRYSLLGEKIKRSSGDDDDDDTSSQNESETELLDDGRHRVYKSGNRANLLHWTAHVTTLLVFTGWLVFIWVRSPKADESCLLKHNVYCREIASVN